MPVPSFYRLLLQRHRVCCGARWHKLVSDSSDVIGTDHGQTSFHMAQTTHIADASALQKKRAVQRMSSCLMALVLTFLFHLGFQVVDIERRDRLIIDV
jgi:hypothetical protein